MYPNMQMYEVNLDLCLCIVPPSSQSKPALFPGAARYSSCLAREPEIRPARHVSRKCTQSFRMFDR